MFEAYAIGVTLKLNNLISPQLALLSQELFKVDGLLKGLQGTLTAIGAESKAIKSIATGANASAAALDKAAVSAGAFERQLLAIRASAAAIGPMPALAPMPNMGGRGPRGPALPPGGGGGGGGGGHGRLGGYNHGGNIHLGPGGIGIGTVGLGAGDAFWPIALTGAAAWGGHALYESAKDLDTERARFRLFGLSEKTNQDAFGFVDGMKSYGVSRNERMKLFRESQGVFRESGESDENALRMAKMALPTMTRLSLAMATMTDEGKAGASHNMLSALRFAEMSGGNLDPARFAAVLDLGFRLSQSSGGQVNFEALRQFKARASTAGFNLTADSLAALEPIMGELTGSTTGTGLRVARNRLQGLVRIPNQAAHTLVDSGIWNKDAVEFNANGGIKRMNARGVMSAENSALLNTAPEEFYLTVLRPMYERMKLDSVGIMRMNGLIFGGGTGGTLFGLIEQNMSKIQLARDALKKQIGLTEGTDKVRETLTGQEAEFTAAWSDFKTVFGTVALPFFSGLLKGGADLLRTVPSMGNGAKIALGMSPAAPFLASFFGATTVMPWLSDKVSDLTHWGNGSSRFGENYLTGSDAGSPYIASAGKGGAGGGIVLNMDGRKVGEIVSGHQARAAGGPQTGSASFNDRLGLTPAGGF